MIESFLVLLGQCFRDAAVDARESNEELSFRFLDGVMGVEPTLRRWERRLLAATTHPEVKFDERTIL